MRISDLSKEIGVSSKEIMDFLKTKGITYTSHFNSVNPDEEQIVREKFSTGKDADGEDSKPATTIIRNRTRRKRSFIPPEERAEVEEQERLEEEKRQKEEAERLAKEEAERAEIEKAEQEKAAKETEDSAKAPEDDEEKPAVEPEKKLSVEEEARLLAAQSEKKETEEKPAVTESEQKEDSQEEDHKASKKHKKIKVVIPESDSIQETDGKSGKRKSRKNREREAGLVKGKVKGGDVRQFMDESYQAMVARKRRKDLKRKKKVPAAPPNPTKAIKKVLKLEDTVLVSDLAKKLGIKVNQLIGKLMAMGEMVGINDRISYDTCQILAEEFGFTTENVALSEDTYLEVVSSKEENLMTRPPVVTVMGHVDHGKTKLLDAIRDTNVVDREAGGITQHICAYSVELEGGKITFLDTPGHEAFTAMRSRGAQATDVVILIVAADDGVMPQTVEAINHAKAAGVPMIVAINKIDKPEANPQKVKNELLKYEIVAEELGGDTLMVEISAKQKINIDGLLETVLLQVEMMDLKSDPNRPAEGIVIESKMDPGKGPVATVLVKEGTLKVGDLVVLGRSCGYVRSMMDWTGERVQEAGPSMAVEITGTDSVPPAGEKLHVFNDEKRARGLVDLRSNKMKEKKFEKDSRMSLENLFSKMEAGDVQDVNIVVKADVDGSVEAIISSLKKIEHEKMNVKIIHSGVGGINENDVLLASASNGIIVGFNVRVDNKAKQVAVAEMVDIRIFSIIYELIDSIKSAMSGMLAPIIHEELIGKVEIRDIFKVGKIGNIAGCMVTDGKAIRKCKVKLVRNNVVVYEGILATLKRFQEDAKEVKKGYECGATIENYNDIKVGDIIECYVDKEVKDEVL